jgi:hypothetical protein
MALERSTAQNGVDVRSSSEKAIRANEGQLAFVVKAPKRRKALFVGYSSAFRIGTKYEVFEIQVISLH